MHRDRYEWYIAKMDHMLRIAKWYMVQVVHCMCTHIVTRDEADQRTRSCCTVMPCLHIPLVNMHAKHHRPSSAEEAFLFASFVGLLSISIKE